MTNSSPSKQTHFSGWLTLAGAMLAYGGICGDVTYAYGVFLPSMNETFGWHRSVLSGPYTLFLIIGGLLGPLVGWTIARFGARKNIILGNIFAALGLLGMSQVGEIWHVYLFFGVMGGLALALTGLALVLAARRIFPALVVVGGVLTGILSAIVSAPIATFVYGGVTGGGTDALVALFQRAGLSVLQSNLEQGLVSDPLDKFVSFVVVWLIVRELSRRYLARVPRASNVIEAN